MSGRDLFNKYSQFIKFTHLIFEYIPNTVLDYFYHLTSSFEGHLSVFYRYCFLYKKTKGRIGENIYIGRNVTLKNIDKFNCGSNVSIHANVYIDSAGFVSIGDNVSIAHNSSIITFDHTYKNPEVPIKYSPTILIKVSIGNDVWIGCGVRVLSGVVIGDRCVVAAGSVVNKSVDTGSLVAGVPAKKIKDIQ